ncbi:MAG: hypothetical protein FJZ58_06645 [Chlamydiae bacterium]|nr:hypothetical protein [Chlamydiota bacterium]
MRGLALEGTKWNFVSQLCSAIKNYLVDFFIEGKTFEAELSSSSVRLVKALDPNHLEGLILDLETEMNFQLAEFLVTPHTDPLQEDKLFSQCRSQVDSVMEDVVNVVQAKLPKDSNERINLMTHVNRLFQTLGQAESVMTSRQKGGTTHQGTAGLAKDLLGKTQDQSSGVPTTFQNYQTQCKALLAPEKKGFLTVRLSNTQQKSDIISLEEAKTQKIHQASGLLLRHVLYAKQFGSPPTLQQVQGEITTIKATE